MRPRQPLLSELFQPRHEHGGAERAGRRKLARPIDPKRPIHLVLKSEHARGKLSLLLKAKEVRARIDRMAKRYGIRVYQYANAGSHIHLVLRAKTRKGFQDFLRVASGQIAQLITGARKGKAFGKFWTSLAWTRVLEWGRAFLQAKAYVLQNELEALGAVPYRRRANAPPLPPR